VFTIVLPNIFFQTYRLAWLARAVTYVCFSSFWEETLLLCVTMREVSLINLVFMIL